MLFDTTLLENFPIAPGVYLMKDATGKVIYVGKANNIKVRVKQYFACGSGRDLRPQVPFLLNEVAVIEPIVVRSPKEALLLENTLIKRHKPKYNILLKDDKSFLGIRLSKDHPFPMLSLARSKLGKDKAADYFGPFTSALKARQLFDLSARLFQLRQCSDEEFKRRSRPCLLHQIKRCTAPCVGLVGEKEYRQQVDRAKALLQGRNEELLRDLKKEMDEASRRLEFERAQECLKKIRLIEALNERGVVQPQYTPQADVIGIKREGEDVVLSRLMYRDGRLVGAAHDEFDYVVEENETLLESYIMQLYMNKAADVPQEIIVGMEIENRETCEEILSEKREKKCSIVVPERGEKKALLDLAQANAEASFRRIKDKSALKEKQLEELQELLQLRHFPRRIECYDSSHLFGAGFVASMVLFVNGEKEKSGYRKFHIKSVEKGDDYAALREVLTRRFAKTDVKKELPDLVIIDGGKGHYNLACQTLSECDVALCDVIAIAKEESRHDKGLTQETIFHPGAAIPIRPERHSPLLRLLQEIRDEAHRFAITFHRKKREKSIIKSALDEVQGIGPVKKKRLLRAFGSVEAIRAKSVDELMKVEGIGKKDAETILKALK